MLVPAGALVATALMAVACGGSHPAADANGTTTTAPVTATTVPVGPTTKEFRDERSAWRPAPHEIVVPGAGRTTEIAS